MSLTVSRRLFNLNSSLTRLTEGSFSSKPTDSNKKPHHHWRGFSAPPAWARTKDPLINSQML